MAESMKEVGPQTIDAAVDAASVPTSSSLISAPALGKDEQARDLDEEKARVAFVSEYSAETVEFYKTYMNTIAGISPDEHEAWIKQTWEDQDLQELARMMIKIEQYPHFYLLQGMEQDNPKLFFLSYLKGANPNHNRENVYPLLVACSRKKTQNLPVEQCVKFLIAAKADVGFAHPECGDTGLLRAADHGHSQTLAILLEGDGSLVLNKVNSNRDTAILCAAAKGHTEVVVTLLKQTGINLNNKNINDCTALICAADKGYTVIVRLLLAHGADASIKETMGSTALILAAKNGHIDIVNMLLPVSEVNDANNEGETALIGAARNGHTEIVNRLLIQTGIKVNALKRKTKKGSTALNSAAYYGHFDTVKVIMETAMGIEVAKENFMNVFRHMQNVPVMKERLVPILVYLLEKINEARKNKSDLCSSVLPKFKKIPEQEKMTKIFAGVSPENIIALLTFASEKLNTAAVEEILGYLVKDRRLDGILEKLCASLKLSHANTAMMGAVLRNILPRKVVVVVSPGTSDHFTFRLSPKEGSELALPEVEDQIETTDEVLLPKNLVESIATSSSSSSSSSAVVISPQKMEIKDSSDHLSSFEIESTIGVNIFSYPLPNSHTSDERVLGIDDLHGNFLKLLRPLLKEAVVSLKKESWEFLVRIYKKSLVISQALARSFDGPEITLSEQEQFSKEELDEFLVIIQQIKATGFQPKIIPDGDEACDRGGNDFFTLALLQQLKAIGVTVSIPVSNHGYAFMKAWEASSAQDRALSLKAAIRQNRPFNQPQHFSSLLGLQYLLEKGLVDPEAVNAMVQDYYSMLQIFDYTLDATGDEIVIFSHTIIDHVRLREVADFFDQRYVDASAAALALTIDDINKAFKAIAKAEFVKLLKGRPASDKVLDKLIWTRLHKDLPADFPPLYGVQIINVHGHTPPTDARKYRHPVTGILYVNLHSKFGMPQENEDPIRLISRDQGLTPEKRALAEKQKEASRHGQSIGLESQDSQASPKREDKLRVAAKVQLASSELPLADPIVEEPPAKAKKKKRGEGEQGGPGKKSKVQEDAADSVVSSLATELAGSEKSEKRKRVGDGSRGHKPKKSKNEAEAESSLDVSTQEESSESAASPDKLLAGKSRLFGQTKAVVRLAAFKGASGPDNQCFSPPEPST